MAIGDTVQAGLGRMDFSAFKTAGAAQAQANQAFGQALEKAAIGFFQGQEKKKKNQEMVQGLTLLFPDDPPELIKFMAKHPEVTQAKLNLDKFNQQKKVQDLQMKQIENVMANTESDRSQAEQNRKETTDFLNFLGQPTYEVDSDGIPSPFASPSPAEQSLMTPQAKAFMQRAIEQNQPIDQALRMAEQIDKQNLQGQPKPMNPKELADLKGKLLDNKQQERNLELPVLTKGEQVIDELTAKEYAEYVNLGGKSAVRSEIKKLNKAIQDLEGSDDLNSWLTGVLPESMKALFNKKGLSVQQAVESVIQGNLRETLGAAFAQKEGEMFLARGYDPRLPDEDNIERVKLLLKEIEDRANARTQTFDYFKKNKTMQGYDGPVFNELSQPSPASSYDPQEIDRLYEEKMRLGKARGLR
jgi:hypothetical protein